MDVLGSFCVVGISLLDLSSHMLQVNCRQFPPATSSLFTEPVLEFASPLEHQCHRRKVCCWTLPFNHLCTGRSIWFSWSVIWCCLGHRLLPDLPAMLIHVHQWWVLFPRGLCHCHTRSICPRKQAVLVAFQTWLSPGSVWWWSDLLLAVLWRSDRLLFSTVSVLPMGRNLQHLLMLPWSCCKWFLGSQGFLWDPKLGSLFLMTLPLIQEVGLQSSLLCLRGLLVPLCCAAVVMLVLWLQFCQFLSWCFFGIFGQVAFCPLAAIGLWCCSEGVGFVGWDCC